MLILYNYCIDFIFYLQFVKKYLPQNHQIDDFEEDTVYERIANELREAFNNKGSRYSYFSVSAKGLTQQQIHEVMGLVCAVGFDCSVSYENDEPIRLIFQAR
jgi:hypothetical protein